MSDFDDGGDDDLMYDSGGDIADDGSQGSEEDAAVQVENKYFEAKDAAQDSKKEGIKGFEEVLELDTEKSQWGFKALKRLCKLNFQLNKHPEVKKRFQQLLKEYATLLMENEKGLNSLLDFLGGSPDIKDYYDLTLSQLEKNGNKKAMLRLELRLAKVLFDNKDYNTLEKKLTAMHRECQLPDGNDDPAKGNQLMDIYALEISMYSARNNNRKLKELYERAIKLKGLCNPRIAGIIHECGGKMHMRERNWTDANTDFFEAFKNYDDAGARKQSCQCLKYLVLANMLSNSNVNPFHEQRAKSYQNNKEIEAMLNLVEAYQNSDLKRFERELRASKESVMDDEFIASYIPDLMKKIRCRVLLERIKPYTNITIGFIAKELNITAKDVEPLLVELILDGKVQGRIDQINQILQLQGATSSSIAQYRALAKWADNLTNLEKTLFGRLN
jgi:COP9 signalosome complex subunit 2